MCLGSKKVENQWDRDSGLFPSIYLVVLHVLVCAVLQQHDGSLHIVHCGSPVQSWFTFKTAKRKGGVSSVEHCIRPCFVITLTEQQPLTEIIDGVHVGVTVDELIHHALHRQPGSQDQRRGAVMHAGIQVCGAIPYQNLKRPAARYCLCWPLPSHTTRQSRNKDFSCWEILRKVQFCHSSFYFIGSISACCWNCLTL